MSVNKSGMALPNEVGEFRAALKKMDLSLNQFCEIVAIEEGNEDIDQENKIRVKVKKQFNRDINRELLMKYWDYLALHANFERAGRVVLPSSSEYLKRSSYSTEIMTSFDT